MQNSPIATHPSPHRRSLARWLALALLAWRARWRRACRRSAAGATATRWPIRRAGSAA